MKYTVKQLAEISGVSVRTLHYYDEIGLLKPSLVKENGYRYYEESELAQLQHILFFKELEFSLEEIRTIIQAKGFNIIEALEDQKKLLAQKQKRFYKLLQTIDTTISALKGGDTMSIQDMFDPFTDTELDQLKKETKQRWGNSNAYKQSAERTKHWTKADYDRIKKEGTLFTQKLAAAMDEDIQSPSVQKLISEHHAGIETFYDCSYEMYRGLGELYVSDPRFTAFYEKFRPGLARWLKNAIDIYCDTHENTKK